MGQGKKQSLDEFLEEGIKQVLQAQMREDRKMHIAKNLQTVAVLTKLSNYFLKTVNEILPDPMHPRLLEITQTDHFFKFHVYSDRQTVRRGSSFYEIIAPGETENEVQMNTLAEYFSESGATTERNEFGLSAILTVPQIKTIFLDPHAQNKIQPQAPGRSFP